MTSFLFYAINSVFGGGFISDAAKLLEYTPNSYGMIDTIINASKNAAIPIASVLLCIYFLIDLSEQMTMDRFSSDQFLKMLIKLAFGEFLITNATGFALQFMNIGVAFVKQIGVLAMAGTSADITREAIDQLGLMDKIAMIVGIIIPFALGFLLKISIFMMCFTRLIEMSLRAMAAPIGVCDIMRGGTNSAGIRYLKRCLGVALQGGLMMLVLIISSEMIKYVTPEEISIFNFESQISYIAVMGATSAAMAATKSLANEVVGA